MFRLLKTIFSVLVYLLGSGVFTYVCYQVLQLIGFSQRACLVASIPLGIIAFVIFLWWNWDNDFRGWHDNEHLMREDEEISPASGILALAAIAVCIGWYFLEKWILK